MAIKFYPSKYPTHFGIAAATELRKAVGNADDIARVLIDSPDIDDADRPRPRSGLEGKFSFQYTVAAALLDGRVGVDTFTDERRFRTDIVQLLEKIQLVREPGRSRDTRNMRVEVSVTLHDGTTHRQICSKPPGSWGEPIDPESHRAKVRDCLGVRLTSANVDLALDLLANLEQLSTQDTQQLLALLA
jgi:aconitate decarboxylase